MDAVGAPGLLQCASTARIGNQGYRCRAVLGRHGALASMLAGGHAAAGFVMDETGDVLISAACTGLLAMRATCAEAPDASHKGQRLASTASAAPTFLASNASLLAKVGFACTARCPLLCV
jgi:hypothetical protein